MHSSASAATEAATHAANAAAFAALAAATAAGAFVLAALVDFVMSSGHGFVRNGD